MPVLYISEVKYLGGASVDFIEVAVTAGTDVSNIQVIVYNASGTVRSTNSLGTLVSTLDGKDVYVIDKTTSATFTGLHKFGGVALVDNGTVDSFISFNDGSPITATAGPANGHETESFHPQKAILNDLDQQVQNEIYEIFPELHAPANAGGYGPTALPALSVSEGQYLAQAIWGGSQTSYQKAS